MSVRERYSSLITHGVTFCLISDRFIKGFMTRNQPAGIDNSEYLAYVRINYLTRLKENLPKTILELDSWLTPPPILKEVIDYLILKDLPISQGYFGNDGIF